MSMINKVNEHNGVSLFIDSPTAVYFYSFGIYYILEEALNKIKKNPSHITCLLFS